MRAWRAALPLPLHPVAGAAAILLCWPTPASATYSIVAVDQGSRSVGGSGTSCVGSLSVRVIYGSAPGKGAVHAQAQLGSPGLDEAVRELENEVPPVDIITTITDLAFDSQAQRRQYGIVDLLGRSAGFTGSQTLDYAEDRQGQVGTFTYSIQGNILTSGAVLDQAADAFAGEGCDLADRLMLALEAGALNGEGDSRCTSQGIPSDSAFLEVDREGEAAGSWLVLEVTDSAPESPLLLLRSQYDAWRTTHPCPAAASDGGPTDGGPTDGGARDASATADAGPGGDGASNDGGCGCRIAGRGTSNAGTRMALLFLLAARLRRRASATVRHARRATRGVIEVGAGSTRSA